MKSFLQLRKVSLLCAVLGALFLTALPAFTASAEAQGRFYYDDDGRFSNGRPSERFVRDRGFENGFRSGERQGRFDRFNGFRSNFRTSAFEYGLQGFRPEWIHEDNYRRGFREGYRNGYNRGFNSRIFLDDFRRGGRRCD
jgi:hypothetical protein